MIRETNHRRASCCCSLIKVRMVLMIRARANSSRVGDNRLYNANALALLPNNELLIADFTSNELRIVRDTDNDGVPDTLSDTPYYSYRFSNDNPLEVAVNSRGVVFSHSIGNDTVMLALYDDNNDGRADRDEVCVEGLSIDNNLFLHGLTVDGPGNVYVIEDASGLDDGSGGNGGRPRIDAFPDRFQDGFLSDGSIFASADDAVSFALSGLAFGPLPANPIDDPQFFVTQHYRDFLNREPDASGLAFWVNQITSCGTDTGCIQVKRINVSAAFFLAIEFQETGFLVYRFYKAAYGNIPNAPVPVTFNEFLPDTRQIGQGVIVGMGDWTLKLEDNKRVFAAAVCLRGPGLRMLIQTRARPRSLSMRFMQTPVSPRLRHRSARQQLMNLAARASLPILQHEAARFGVSRKTLRSRNRN